MKKPTLKDIFKIVYIVIFLVICLAPASCFVYLYSNGIETGADIEKKEKKSFPAVYTQDGINSSFDTQCEEWINSNLPFREYIVTGINIVLSDILEMPTANVVAGRNGWIYSTETVDNYLDTNPLSSEDIRSIGVTLSLIQENVKSAGGNFLFVPVPNKNSVYPEYMPVRYIKSDENNLTRLGEKLENLGVNHADFTNRFASAKGETLGRLYYKRDTHWTIFGAMIGYKEIMEGLGRTSKSYDIGNFSSAKVRIGDLDKLLYPVGYTTEEEYMPSEIIDYDSFEFVYPTGVSDTRAQLENFMSDKEDHDNNFSTKQKNPGDDSSLYMIRDSFARAILPYMIDSYADATFVRTTSPSVANIPAGSDVVYEICERNLGNLILTAPYMYAPERVDRREETFAYNSTFNRCIFNDEGYALRIYGTIDSKMVGEDGRIFVNLTDEKSQIRVFEAFPIYEDSLLADETSQPVSPDEKSHITGYSLYIDKNMLADGEYGISVSSGNNESDVIENFSIVSDVTEDDANEESHNDSDKEAQTGSEDTKDKEERNLNPYEEENAGHQIVYRGVKIGIGSNINYLKAKLKDQAAPSEIITSCLSGEDAVVYYYPSITIESAMDGNIYYISLMDNSYSDGKEGPATESGITIGSDKMDIWDKLGDPQRENDKNCTYKTEHLNISYSYKNGKVTSVILEDNKYTSEDDEEAQEEEAKAEAAGVEYEGGNTYLYDDTHIMQTGWQIIDGQYYFFDRITGQRVVGAVVDGIAIGEGGEVVLTPYQMQKVATMMKAHQIVAQITSPGDSMEVRRRKAFDWILSFPYHRYRHLKDVYTEEGIEIVMANDIFDSGAGDCVSESAALAFLFHEIGYNNVYWVHDTGHSWVRSDDKLFDPLFAEARDFDANYNAEFTDYRKMMTYSVKIY